MVALVGTFFFMSIMFRALFALGIFRLGPNSRKKASIFVVVSNTGGALMPKLMGRLGDLYNMSFRLLMPLVCFALTACSGFFRSKLSKAPDPLGVVASKGH